MIFGAAGGAILIGSLFAWLSLRKLVLSQLEDEKPLEPTDSPIGDEDVGLTQI